MTLMVLGRITSEQVHLTNRAAIMRKRQAIIALIMMAFILPSCNYCKLFGDNKLGDNFSLLEGDKIGDRVIVYCTGKSGRCCHAGIPVIPYRSDSTSSYVADAISNDKWIIAITINKTMSESYWIINKDFKAEFQYDDDGKFESVIQSHVTGPLDLSSFQKKKEELEIDLTIKK